MFFGKKKDKKLSNIAMMDSKVSESYVEEKVTKIQDHEIELVMDNEEAISKKLSNAGPLRKYAELGKIMFAMLKDVKKGKYPHVPWFTIATIAVDTNITTTIAIVVTILVTVNSSRVTSTSSRKASLCCRFRDRRHARAITWVLVRRYFRSSCPFRLHGAVLANGKVIWQCSCILMVVFANNACSTLWPKENK